MVPPDRQGTSAAGEPGAVLFARYAYPPNERGYCGPVDHRALLEYSSARVVDPGLRHLAAGFAGAWPYLRLIAEASGIGDPLDRRVVESYWVGNRLLERIDRTLFGNSVRDRFRSRTGRNWYPLAEAVPAGAVPHHSFHVFCVYPWVGLLGSDRGATPLHILDRCRIRWGSVLSVHGDRLLVRSRPLRFDSGQLSLGPAVVESARYAVDGYALLADPRPGDTVSLHWDWVCDRLDARQVAALRHYTARQLDITNHRIGRSGPAAAIDGKIGTPVHQPMR